MGLARLAVRSHPFGIHVVCCPALLGQSAGHLQGGRRGTRWPRPNPPPRAGSKGPGKGAGPFIFPCETEAERAERTGEDRKRGVEGKSVSERVDLGGRQNLKKKKQVYKTYHHTH